MNLLINRVLVLSLVLVLGLTSVNGVLFETPNAFKKNLFQLNRDNTLRQNLGLEFTSNLTGVDIDINPPGACNSPEELSNVTDCLDNAEASVPSELDACGKTKFFLQEAIECFEEFCGFDCSSDKAFQGVIDTILKAVDVANLDDKCDANDNCNPNSVGKNFVNFGIMLFTLAAMVFTLKA